MKIKRTLLDTECNFSLDSITVGEKIKAAGKQFLWAERCSSHVDVVVIHYISASGVNPFQPFDFKSIMNIFCEYQVSSHYLITRRGAIFSLVPEQYKAWHCGGSVMPAPDNRRGVNEFSIGIELMATEKSGFTKLQYKALCRLCDNIEKRYCRFFSYIGHDEIAGDRAVAEGLRKDVKPDPGPLFNWELFRNSLQQLREARSI